MTMLGLVEAVRTARSRITHQDLDREGGLAQPIKHRPWPLVYGYFYHYHEEPI